MRKNKTKGASVPFILIDYLTSHLLLNYHLHVTNESKGMTMILTYKFESPCVTARFIGKCRKMSMKVEDKGYQASVMTDRFNRSIAQNYAAQECGELVD